MIIILNSRSKFHPYFNWLKFKEISNELFRRIINLGFPTAMQMLFEVGVFTAAIWLAGTIGTIDQAANQIALNLSSMTFMVAMGFSVAAMIRVGNQKGMKRFRELRRIAFSIFLLSTILAVVFCISFLRGQF